MDFSKALFFVIFVKTLPIRFQNNDLNTYNNRFSSFPNHEKLVEAIFGECLNYKGGLRVSRTQWLCTREYFCPSRLCAVAGTGERTRF